MPSLSISKLTKLFALLFCGMALLSLPGVDAHAYMAVPAARNAKWKCGFPDAAANYDLTGLSAGGPAQVRGAGAGHGVCGDPALGPQHHLEGGKYTQDKSIVAKYRPGESFEVTVQVTAHHSGWFEFNLCPIGTNSTDWHKPVTQACLNKYPLERADGHGYRYWINSGATGHYRIPLVMPNIECERCVLQYYWQTSNSGCNANTEEFWNCADIAVKKSFSSAEVGPTKPASSSCIFGNEYDTPRDQGCPAYESCPRDYDPKYTVSMPCVGPRPDFLLPEGPAVDTSSSSFVPHFSSSSSVAEDIPETVSSSSSVAEEIIQESSSSHPQDSTSDNVPVDEIEQSCEGRSDGDYCVSQCGVTYFTCAGGRVYKDRPAPPGTVCVDGSFVWPQQCPL